MTVKREQMSHRVQQSCTPHLYGGHIRHVSVFIALLYCFSENQPQIGPKKAATLGGGPTRQTDGREIFEQSGFHRPLTDRHVVSSKSDEGEGEKSSRVTTNMTVLVVWGGNRSVQKCLHSDFRIYRTNEIILFSSTCSFPNHEV